MFEKYPEVHIWFPFMERQTVPHAHASAFKISLWINKAYVLSIKQAPFFFWDCIKGVAQYLSKNLNHRCPTKSWNQSKSWSLLSSIPRLFCYFHQVRWWVHKVTNMPTCHPVVTADQLLVQRYLNTFDKGWLEPFSPVLKLH